MKNMRIIIFLSLAVMSILFAGCKNPFPQNPEDYSIELKKTGNFDYINVYFQLNKDFVPVYEKYQEHITYGAQVDGETEQQYQQNVQCEVLDVNTRDSKCSIVVMGMSPFSADESLEITISLSINDSKCDDFMAEAGANICTATTPHLLTSGNEVVDVSTAGQDVSDETVYQEDSPLLSGDYGTICADSPMHGDCDYDKDGVSNRLDPCVEEPEEFSSDGKTPLDGINDGCPNSSAGGQTGQKYSNSNNSFDQTGGGSAYPQGGYLSSGGSKCSFVQGSTFSLAEVILMLMPLIVISLGYASILKRVGCCLRKDEMERDKQV